MDVHAVCRQFIALVEGGGQRVAETEQAQHRRLGAVKRRPAEPGCSSLGVGRELLPRQPEHRSSSLRTHRGALVDPRTLGPDLAVGAVGAGWLELTDRTDLASRLGVTRVDGRAGSSCRHTGSANGSLP